MSDVFFKLRSNNQFADADDSSCMAVERTLFASPLEPDWLLVYESDQCRPTPHLVALIDLASGMQRDPYELQYTSRLLSMTSWCPSLLRFSPTLNRSHPHQKEPSAPSSNSTLLELNNYGAYAHDESLSQLVDPQGGYVFYL